MRHLLALSRKFAGFSALTLALTIVINLTPQSAQANDYCDTCENYAANLWQSTSYGARTDIEVQDIENYDVYTAGIPERSTIISKPLYFKDTNNTDGYCTQKKGFCYIYAGYGRNGFGKAIGADPYPDYIWFWGDNRPGHGFNFHANGIANSAVGSFGRILINKQIYDSNHPETLCQWNITMVGSGVENTTSTSTDNCMKVADPGDYIIISIYTDGNVLASGNYAQNARFVNTYAISQQNGGQSLAPLTTDGQIIQGGPYQPPYAGWYFTPSNDSNHTGGSFYTQCC